MKPDNFKAKLSDADRLNRDIVEAHVVAMLEHYKRINEGANSVIGLINFSELDERLIDYFFQGKEKPSNEKLAIKMLKVYTDANLAKSEGELQIKARELLADNPIPGVDVPEVYFCDSVPVMSDDLKNHLIAEGIDLEDNKIGVVLMDFIEGEDMLTYLYKEALKKYQVVKPEENKKLLSFSPDLAEVDTQLEHGAMTDFPKLQNRVSLALDLKLARNSLDQPEVRQTNMEKLVKFFSDNDLVIDEAIIERLAQTISLFNKNGLYHRDLHERNVMLSFGDDNKTIDRLSVIDFGLSALGTPGDDDIYIEGDKKFPNDNYLVWSYKAITKPKAELEKEQFFSKLNKNLNNIKNNKQLLPRYDALLNQVSDIIKSGEEMDEVVDEINDLIIDLADGFIKESSSLEDNLNLRLSIWQEIISIAPQLVDEVNKKLTTWLDPKRHLPRYAQTTLNRFLNYLIKIKPE